MTETKNLTGLDGSQSVSALGLRWAALRGMLTSPLIMVEDQRHLREELLRELGVIEHEFVSLPSRNATEISAKIDIAKSALRDGLQAGQSWLIELLDSIQNDLQATNAKVPGANRSTANLARAYQQRNEAAAPAASEPETTPAA
ncbi:hypothetical protein [Microvirga alba]|uniref:Uncharacterized protein n=1 Tax=Microvirga alba TaxID=2791025 RepID=A0A931FN56_9HYPH|nr:hypothetical protein [Microvirga alba]MBF9233315.1 hypothetical protein [Microvirga alba]